MKEKDVPVKSIYKGVEEWGQATGEENVRVRQRQRDRFYLFIYLFVYMQLLEPMC